MERYDIAIIGTGPAGISAAVTAKVRGKNILLLGNRRLSDKVEKAHTIANYPGLPNVSGEELQQAFIRHLKKMDIPVTEDRAAAIYAMGEYFAIQGHSADYEAASVILAVGMTSVKPYPGEVENLGRGVSYCATCDAALYRGRSAIVVSFSGEEEKEAEFLAEMADRVFYLPMYESAKPCSERIEIARGKPKGIERAENGMRLITDEGVLEADGIFILREQMAPAQLVRGIEMVDNHIRTDRWMRTNIKGLFACGDITGKPYQYVKAAGEGNVAALSAVDFLAERGD